LVPDRLTTGRATDRRAAGGVGPILWVFRRPAFLARGLAFGLVFPFPLGILGEFGRVFQEAGQHAVELEPRPARLQELLEEEPTFGEILGALQDLIGEPVHDDRPALIEDVQRPSELIRLRATRATASCRPRFRVDRLADRRGFAEFRIVGVGVGNFGFDDAPRFRLGIRRGLLFGSGHFGEESPHAWVGHEEYNLLQLIEIEAIVNHPLEILRV
jgi:hypothetical protein